MSLLTDLISYWKLDEASGNALDAHSTNDLTDTNTVGSGTGIIGNGRDFEVANTEKFTRGDNAALSVGDIDFTFACWVKIESKSGDMSIIGKGGSNDLPFNLDHSSPSGDRFRFRLSSAAGFANITSAPANSLGAPSTGVWYFIVCWHDSVANTINIQVNNGTVDSVSYTHGSYDDGGDFEIGAFPFYNNYFDGIIDEVGFWKRVLDSTERSNLYNSGAGLPYSSFGGAAAHAHRKINNPRLAGKIGGGLAA